MNSVERLKQIEKSRQITMKITNLLSDLGYDMKNRDKKVFIGVIDYCFWEWESDMKYESDEFVKKSLYEMITSKYSSMYMELGSFVYEVGVNNLHNLLKSFQETRVSNNTELENDIFIVPEEKLNPYNSIFFIVNHLIEESKAKAEVKELNCIDRQKSKEKKLNKRCKQSDESVESPCVYAFSV